jgi:ATP-binding cassette subfamily F protein uup
LSAFLLVSHDREFLDNVVTSTFVLEGDGLVKQFPGGYEDYLRQRGAAAERNKSAPSAPPQKKPVKIEVKKRPLPFAAEKRREFSCNPFAGL